MSLDGFVITVILLNFYIETSEVEARYCTDLYLF